MVIIGLMSVVNMETIIPEGVLGVLEDFKELNADELANNFPLMQHKRGKGKVFNMGDGVVVFRHKGRFSVGTNSKLQPYKYAPFKVTLKIDDNAYMVALMDSINISNTFNVSHIHEYQADATFSSIREIRVKFFRGGEDLYMKVGCGYQRRSCVSKRFGMNCAGLASDIRMTTIIPFRIGNQLRSLTHCFIVKYGPFKPAELVSSPNTTF